MITIENITSELENKIKFVRGLDYPSRLEFESQAKTIMTNYRKAFESSNNSSGHSGMTYENIEDLGHWLNSHPTEHRLRRDNEIFKEIYAYTNCWTEKQFTGGLFPLNLVDLFQFGIESKNLKAFAQSLGLVTNAARYLGCEEVSEAESYVVNLTNGKDILHLENIVPSQNYTVTALIYLMFKKRIVRLEISDKGLKSSKEIIIRRDIKKIEIQDDVYMHLYYHGVHESDVLYLESYKATVKLRKRLTSLRDGAY